MLSSDEVSVSTSGSKGVQQDNDLDLLHETESLSIHKRIEGGATVLAVPVVGWLVVFQYPQADRRGCNGGLAGGGLAGGAFQYPQADRRGCNQARFRSS